MSKKYIIVSLLLLLTIGSIYGRNKVYKLSEFGLKPNTGENASPYLRKALNTIKLDCKPGDQAILRFPQGRYDFYEDQATLREYYISNHDQTNPKKVGIAIEDIDDFILDGQGSSFVFHGRMLPLSLLRSQNCTLKDFSIDFENPHIAQVKVIANDPEQGLSFEVSPEVNYRINSNGYFETYGENWQMIPSSGIAFEDSSRHLVYRTSDLSYSTQQIKEIGDRQLQAPLWKDKRLSPGTIIAMRSYYRPAPGIFLSHNKNSRLENIRIHYAEGMGLLAQVCENITLNKFSVCLKGKNDPRYFTTQADATHFSGCKGKITSENGLYEGMMDDAINIHGTYLKVTERIDDKTLVGKYMHSQSYGFEWGRSGDTVQFIRSATMEIAGAKNKIISITPYDKEEIAGAKEFLIQFEKPLDKTIQANNGFGIENLEWTPEVLFKRNTIRNNRARGALFSTPKTTIIENNIFDHTSGTAILLCGDCNGWYETGACRKVIIRNNKFINSLTNLFQFTNAIISIYPEIPDLKNQKQYFHGGTDQGIIIENNIFETFDYPLIYAKSLDGLQFHGNTIRKNQDYPAFHWNTSPFLLEHVKNIDIRNNNFEEGFDYTKDVKEK